MTATRPHGGGNFTERPCFSGFAVANGAGFFGSEMKTEWEEQYEATQALLADIDPEGMYGGISGIWRLPANHPFQKIWKHHDAQYVLAQLGYIKAPSSKEVDKTTKRDMIACARALKSRKLEYQARYVFYPMMRTWGFFRWPIKAQIEEHL